MTAVIYARYSSDNQREESIEGQIRECTAYAEKNGITVVKHYIDRALSAKTDNRPDFQQMIKDSEKRLFDIVLVWKLDRFARNRYDSAHYEYQLERNHVKLVSATEPISDSPAGIMVKSMLTGMAEYYSAELSEKVVRGMTENVLKGKYNGGTIPIGFKVDEEKFFQIDPLKAPFVVEAFQRYNDGATMKELMNWLNDSGVTTNRNQKFTYNSVQTLLTNKRYIGENHFKDIVMPDSIPAIVDKDLFEEVQQKIKKNSRAPARHKAEDDYLLTTKLFCGMCGAMMFGECGTGRNKVVHHYYKCATAKRFKTCKKKTVRKEWLEDLVIAETMKLIQDDAVIDAIVAEVMELQDQENTTLPLLEKQMREVENGIENMLNAIQAGVLTNSTKSRLEKLEAQQKELEVRIAEEKIARPRLSENQVRFWLTRFRKLDPNVKSHRETLINTFVNAVYLYDEKVLITFNYKDGTKTITFDEIAAKDAPEGNGSDLGWREVENGIENMLNAIQAGVLTNSTKSRLEKLEAQQKELEVRIAEEKIARPRLSENQVRFWLTRFRKLDPNVKSHRETLINTFVNAVYLYDEKVLIAFNYKDGTKTITFDEIAAQNAPEGNGSDLGCFAPPKRPA